MRERILIAGLLIILFGCSPKSVKPISGYDDYAKALDEIASQLAENIPEGQRIVVFNILKDGREETQNSVDLAIKLGSGLARKGIVVIERGTGERLVYEERKYTVREPTSQELIELLKGFQADIGIMGEYTFHGNYLYLDNIRAVAVPKPGRPPRIFTSIERRLLKLRPQDSLCFAERELPLPQPPDPITHYLLSSHTRSDFVSTEIVDRGGNILPDNCARIGSYYRLRITLKEDLFLYIFSYDQDNNTVYLIHPLNPAEDKQISKGTYLIPHGEDALLAQPPAGKNFVKVFATRKPIPIMMPASTSGVLTSKEVETFVKGLKSLSERDWSSDRIFIHIVE